MASPFTSVSSPELTFPPLSSFQPCSWLVNSIINWAKVLMTDHGFFILIRGFLSYSKSKAKLPFLALESTKGEVCLCIRRGQERRKPYRVSGLPYTQQALRQSTHTSGQIRSQGEVYHLPAPLGPSFSAQRIQLFKANLQPGPGCTWL